MRRKDPARCRATPLSPEVNDPFALLQQVVRHRYELQPYDVSSLENNMLTMQILEAARISAESGKVVHWKELYGD